MLDTAPLRNLDEVMRAERPAIVATLIRVTGDWDLAEDCVQDALAKALERWPSDGTPRNMAAWLTTVARHRALDLLRRRRNEHAKLVEVAIVGEREHDPPASAETIIDDRLRLIFTCCHPALPLESRVGLTLKTVAGLSTEQIAGAFLVSETTMSQRILRAKRKIGAAGIGFRTPPPHRLPERTGAVLAVIYLIFNAGYRSPDGVVAAEALRLARLVVDLLPDDNEARGLLALLMFQHARRSGRFDGAGHLIPMEEQDRTTWDRALMQEGREQLCLAQRSHGGTGPYAHQAAIAACHALAPDAAMTDWRSVVRHYDALIAAQPSPVIALNRAIAIGFRDGPSAGLGELDLLTADSQLVGYHLLPAARADFLRRLDRIDDAAVAYRQACDLAPTVADRRFLLRRLAELPD